MEIQWIDIDLVIPYARNARVHDQSIDKLVASLKEYGWQQPTSGNIYTSDHNQIVDNSITSQAANKSRYGIRQESGGGSNNLTSNNQFSGRYLVISVFCKYTLSTHLLVDIYTHNV